MVYLNMSTSSIKKITNLRGDFVLSMFEDNNDNGMFRSLGVLPYAECYACSTVILF